MKAASSGIGSGIGVGLCLALSMTLPTVASANDEPTTRTRFAVMASPSFVAMHVFDVPVHFIDVPVGIGAAIDDGNVGFEWYGMMSLAQGWTQAGRHASSFSPFGSRMVLRVEMVRVLAGFRIFRMQFDPAHGLTAGDGLEDGVAMGELGLGVDIGRLFAGNPDHVRSTITLDFSTQWYGGLGGGASFAIALGAHL